jgi:DNA-binding SARP family transcriptional activator
MRVCVQLLGGFSVTVDGAAVPDAAWSRRQAAGLVKLLALSRGRRLHREQVIDALWPDTPPDVAAPRLHKAAHYARRALGDHPGALVLRQDVVALLPEDEVSVDALEFRAEAERALAEASAEDGSRVLARYSGPLLPEDVYDAWTAPHREATSALHHELLRLTGRWERLLEEDPSDEQAHLALVRAAADRGDVRTALRQLERMDQVLRRELGTAPSPAAEELRRSLLGRRTEDGASPAPGGDRRLVGRRDVGDLLRDRMARADTSRGSALLVTGPPGVGKTAVLELATALADRRGWRIGAGTASAIEGPWPYAPVLEALSDLCRRHPSLLDGLDDNYRQELDRALSASEVSWTGESAHQRLFVAAAELLRLAAAGHGLLLVVDDIHEADEASLRLLHYLARVALTERVVIVLAHRQVDLEPLDAMQASLIARGIGTRVDLDPLPEAAVRRLLRQRFPDLDDATLTRIGTVSGGLPFTALELARAAAEGRAVTPVSGLPRAAQRTFQRVAMLGATFTTDELLALADVGEAEAYRQLEAALAALLVEPAETGYRFRHALLREALLGSMPPHAQAAARRAVAERLAGLGAAPARVAHQFLAAGQPLQAIPYVIPAVETAGALGAYRDALALVEAVLPHSSGPALARLLARRGDLLMALGDPGSIAAYREAVPVTSGVEQRLVRARLARAASFAGDLQTARTALAGLGLENDAADGPMLLARGNLAYFTGDIDAAWDAASTARDLLHAPDDPWYFIDLVALQGLIAHQRGEWFERFRLELRRTQGNPGLATALFDAHLCVAEFLLYGPVPYEEVIEQAEQLRRRAAHVGALRGVAFATALIGEAALLAGDLDRAERELREARDLHRETAAAAGEAHSLQRLAEVMLARGNRQEARRLLQRALPLGRWSVMALHVVQRVYGTMITAAEDPWAARAVVDEAEATVGETDICTFCSVALAVPASIACARVHDLEGARRHLAMAEFSAAHWGTSFWDAAVLEARAHLALAEGRADAFETLLDQAATLFAAAGHSLDAERCRAERRSPAAVAVPS